MNVFKLADFVICFILLAASTRIHDTLDSDFFIAMSSSDSDVAASDLSLAARELDERLQEPPSTPPAFETTARAGKGKGKGKGKRGKKAVEGQLTEDPPPHGNPREPQKTKVYPNLYMTPQPQHPCNLACNLFKLERSYNGS